MKKSDLTLSLNESMPDLPKEAVRTVVDIFFERILDALYQSYRVEIRGFGSLQAKQRNSRRVKIPNSNTSFKIPPRKVPTFRASKEFLNRLNHK